MKDSNMATPALVPGFAHSGSPTVLSSCKEARVSAQSTAWKVERRNTLVFNKKRNINDNIFN